MPRIRQADRRRHLITFIIALFLALAILIIQSETASAAAPAPVGATDAERVYQADDDGAPQIVTTERILLLGMLALVGLTLLYLRWRPTPRADGKPDRDRPSDQKSE